MDQLKIILKFITSFIYHKILTNKLQIIIN